MVIETSSWTFQLKLVRGRVFSWRTGNVVKTTTVMLSDDMMQGTLLRAFPWSDLIKLDLVLGTPK